MNIYILSIIIYIIIALLFAIFYLTKSYIEFKNNQTKKIEGILNIINNPKNKNRKYINKTQNNNKYNSPNSSKNINNTTNLTNRSVSDIRYKKIAKINVNTNYLKPQKNAKETYVECKNRNFNSFLLKIYTKIAKQLNKNNFTYRAIKHKTLVELISIKYANDILLELNFNIFDEFQRLSEKIKIYKKEASILKNLIIVELIKIYIKLSKDIFKIKSQIKKAEKTTFISKTKKYHPAFIYGLYKFNPNCMKFFAKRSFDIIKATSLVILELDQIGEKQKVIYNYVKFLLG